MAYPKIFVKDKNGKSYNLTEVRTLLDVSQAWVHKHRTDSITLEELQTKAKKIKRRSKKIEVPPRVDINEIPAGSWEAQLPCPSPGHTSIKAVLRNALHANDFVQRDAYLADKEKTRKQREKRARRK